MSVALHVPLAVKGKTTEELSQKLIEVQTLANGKVSILSISQDFVTKEWVCWYYPLRNLGGGVM